jgi:hypothetical protein
MGFVFDDPFYWTFIQALHKVTIRKKALQMNDTFAGLTLRHTINHPTQPPSVHTRHNQH